MAPKPPAKKVAAKPSAKPTRVTKTAAKVPISSPESGTAEEVNQRQSIFVREYLVSLDATQAAIAAGYAPGSAKQIGHKLLQRPDVMAVVEAAQAERRARLDIDGDVVVKQLWSLATADHRELTEHRVGACRYCWGKGHRLQRTVAELERDRAEHQALVAQSRAQGAFDEKGGTGYSPVREPNDLCPECFGEGVGRVIVNDTTKLSPQAARLFAGVRKTKDGVEVKTHDQIQALTLIGRHLGLWNDKLKVDAKIDIVEELRGFLGAGSRLPIATDTRP